MKSEEQRIAIAEACGWIRAYKEGDDEGCGSWSRHRGNQNLKQPPDYLNDLNAMHEAEKILTDFQWDIYSVELGKARGLMIRFVHATSSQRAEAFLRTLNLWKPSENE